MNRLLSQYEKVKKFPFGQALFSYIVAQTAPYFLSIRPTIMTLAPHVCKVKMRKRRRVENHLKTVHAIAMCNMCELAGGLCVEASIPAEYRWIPKGMQVNYVKKAKTDLTAICELGEIDWANCEEVNCFVSVRDMADVEVMNANIQMKISLR